jgi:hypothetical protein
MESHADLKAQTLCALKGFSLELETLNGCRQQRSAPMK